MITTNSIANVGSAAKVCHVAPKASATVSNAFLASPIVRLTGRASMLRALANLLGAARET